MWCHNIPCHVQPLNYPLHLLQGLSLHQDVVFGQEQRRYLGEFFHVLIRRVRYDSSQVTQRVVKIVHASPFTRIDKQPQRPGLDCSAARHRVSVKSIFQTLKTFSVILRCCLFDYAMARG